MNVVLYGATGNAGTRILQELLSRGHSVCAVVRSEKSLSSKDRLTVKAGDIKDDKSVAEAARGSDAVLSAYGPGLSNPNDLVLATTSLIEGVKKSGSKRLLTVGGAGTLQVAPGTLLVDSLMLPSEWKPIARAHVEALKLLQGCDLNWSCLAPAAFFEPGERIGKFRLGKDELIVNGENQSRISMEDFAIAFIDELENQLHPRQRFSVGY